ncbi:hypothetical protein TVAG_354550 [Trichomonas vaginalis G3]|uniref:Uncharacterized protein n=1 Tax=Trichomonas vaginalis (strain ATCC PRA-98 / G3) TaxID=412133 RepID=A2FMY7_TRIV3|nr:WD40 repeat-containing protein [Trichomonas vaginalis G3]EAX93716.1 hypothetical protein TVAG_354550 [Trichomonas vaginalis G3]KAI5498733.1 WD40 repeat-containing protein [Trichomonas vaginalis G3]|eukprot:XP_001306646.1 hypothetical protein [Trichomonas vaginalis G3]
MNKLGKPALFKPVSKPSGLNSRAVSGRQEATNNSRESTNVTIELKNRFQTFAESAELFYKKHEKHAKFGNNYMVFLLNAYNSFNSLFNVLIRMCGNALSLKPGKKPGLISGAHAIQTVAIPFIKDWNNFTQFLEIFEKSCEAQFMPLIDHHLNDIIELAPSIMTQLQALRKGIISSFEETEKRLEASQAIEVSIEEICRNDINEKCFKIFGNVLNISRESVTYDADASNLMEEYQHFQVLLQQIIDQLELRDKCGELRSIKYHGSQPVQSDTQRLWQIQKQQTNDEEVQQQMIQLKLSSRPFTLNPELPLFDFIIDARSQFGPETTPHISMFFDALTECALNFKETFNNDMGKMRDEYLGKNEELLKRGEKLQDTIDKLMTDKTKLNAEIQYRQEKVNMLESAIENLGKYKHAFNKVHNIEKTEDLAEHEIMQIMKNSMKSDECQSCKDYENKLQKISQFLEVFGTENTDVMERAENASKVYKNFQEEIEKLKKERDEYKNCIQQIVACFKQTDNKETDYCRFAIQAAKNNNAYYEKKVKDTEAQYIVKSNTILEKVCEAIGIKAGTIDDLILAINKKNESNNVFLQEVEIRLCKISKTNASKTTNQETIRNALSSVENMSKTQKPVEKVEEKSDLTDIFKRIQRITGNSDNSNANEVYSKCIELLEELATLVSNAKRELRHTEQDQVQNKASLQSIYEKLSRILQIQSVDTKSMDSTQLMHQIMSSIDALFNRQQQMMSNEEISTICQEVLKDNSISQKNEPKIYLGEICYSYLIYKNSIECLIPFNNILDELFTTFDCKSSSFKPTSQQFPILRKIVSSLQDKLNSIASNRISTDVFHNLSRFISLINSFMTSLASLTME